MTTPPGAADAPPRAVALPSARRHACAGALLLRTQPDSRLIKLFQTGHDGAFEEIVRRYRAPLVVFAARIAGAAEADDIVQEALATAYRVLPGERPIRELRPWLYTVVRNRSLNDIAARRRSVEPLSEDALGSEDPSQVVDARARLAVLVERLRELPARQRQAILKREFEGLDYRAVADDLELTVSAAKQLVYRARSRLRDAAGVLVPPPVVRALATQGAELAGGGVGVGFVKVAAAAGALSSLLALGVADHVLRPERAAVPPASAPGAAIGRRNASAGDPPGAAASLRVMAPLLAGGAASSKDGASSHADGHAAGYAMPSAPGRVSSRRANGPGTTAPAAEAASFASAPAGRTSARSPSGGSDTTDGSDPAHEPAGARPQAGQGAAMSPESPGRPSGGGGGFGGGATGAGSAATEQPSGGGAHLDR